MFHEYYFSDGHESIANWCATLIDQVEEQKEVKNKRTLLHKQVEYLGSSWV